MNRLDDIKNRIKEFKETCETDVAFYGWIDFEDVEYLIASQDKAIAALKKYATDEHYDGDGAFRIGRVRDPDYVFGPDLAVRTLRELGEL